MTAEASDHVLRFLGPVSAPAFLRMPLVGDVSLRGRCALDASPPSPSIVAVVAATPRSDVLAPLAVASPGKPGIHDSALANGGHA